MRRATSGDWAILHAGMRASAHGGVPGRPLVNAGVERTVAATASPRHTGARQTIGAGLRLHPLHRRSARISGRAVIGRAT
jgi:hypothetical protein